MKKVAGCLILLLTITGLGQQAFSAIRQECTVCGMYIDQYQKTAGHLVTREGEIYESCGLACLLRIVDDHGGPQAFSQITVKDWNSGQDVSAESAFYVLSSSLIPDMMPNIIAFMTELEAAKFKEKHGGVIISFTEALLVISPTAMTMPTRLQTAVVPAEGAFGIGLGQMHMVMDQVVIGDDSVDPADFIQRPGQMMGPRKMTADGTMLMTNYGVTDSLALGVSTAYLNKEMQMYQMGGKKTVKERNDGLGDTTISLRYNFLKSDYYDHFLTAMVASSLPTGDFESRYITSPGLQLGTGDLTFTGGLLYTYRYNKAWLHSQIGYTYNLENSNNFKFGDQTKFGLALHYTPDYDTMFGIEADATYYDKNELFGKDVANSGGLRSTVSAVASYRFLNALGGNFNLKFAAGIPLYEDLDHGTQMGMDTVQLGGGWYASLSVSYKRRLSHH